ncbi:MAG: hypothetical protein IT310_13530 [Anaerolineales bacterium]|nr:hypothetical protein [Anaerolineales bacterium]
MLNEKKLLALKAISYSVWFIILFLVASKGYTMASAFGDETRLPAISKIEKNGVSVSVNKVTTDRNNGKTDIVACIDLPSNADWLPYAKLKNGSEVITFETTTVIDPIGDDASNSSHRCYRFIFPKELHNKKVILSIEKLQISLPESLTQEMCLEAQNKIQVDYPDFLFSCKIGDHGISYVIDNLPKSMDEIEAYSLINGALTSAVVGPWELDVTLP